MILTPIQRAWFVATVSTDVILAWALLKIINNLPNLMLSDARKKEISSVISCLMFRFIFLLNPQIQIKSLCNWNMLDKAKGPFVVLINHTSPFDSVLFAASFPLKYASKIKTLAKAELFDMPFFGEILKYCGHFPVHFQSAAVGSFSVDKDKQDKVLTDIKTHLTNGGSLAFFPEGQLNRFDTKKLQAFRLGMFKIFSELSFGSNATAQALSLYAFLHKGMDKVWHPEAKIGGDAAKVKCNLFPLRFSTGTQVPEIQQAVQEQLDTVHSAKGRPSLSKL